MKTLVNKMGSYHSEYGLNNQDSGFEYKNVICIVDGCSGGNHSEVGAKLFVKKFRERLQEREIDYVTYDDIIETFELVMGLVTRKKEENLGGYLDDVMNYMCFTILVLQESEEEWKLMIFGDGMYITEDLGGFIDFTSIDKSNTPNYLAYSYVDKEYLEKGQKGRIDLHNFEFPKKNFKSVGIASDGLEKIRETDHEFEFKELIASKNEWAIRRKINALNRQYKDGGGFFKDDITIGIK